MHCNHCGYDIFPDEKYCNNCGKPVRFKPLKRTGFRNKTALALIIIFLVTALGAGIFVVFMRPETSYFVQKKEEAQSKQRPKVILPIDESISCYGSSLSGLPLYGGENEAIEHLLSRTFPGATFKTYYERHTSFTVHVTAPNGAFFGIKGYFEACTAPDGKSSKRAVLSRYE